MRRISRHIAALVVPVVMVPTLAFACRCIDTTVEERYQTCASIFIADVVAASPARVTVDGMTGAGRRVYIRVVESFKGSLHAGDMDVYVAFDAGSACGIPIALGQRLIVYEYGRSRFVGSCNSARGAQMVSEAREIRDLIALRHEANQGR
jgi:hypothetical protein